MAIVRMQKFNLITFSEYQENLLEKLQDFQEVELFDSGEFYQESVPLFSRLGKHPRTDEIESSISQVAWSRNFLNQYLPKLSLIEGLRQPLKRYTLRQLSEHAHTFDWRSVYEKLRQTDKRLRFIDQERRELSSQEDELNIWSHFDENPSVLTTLDQSIGLLGTLPSSELSRLTESLDKLPDAYLEVIHQNTTSAYILILVHKDSRQKATSFLRSTGFEEYYYPFDGKPSQDLQTIKKKAEELATEEASLKKELKAMQADYYSLGLIAEYLEGLLLRVNSNEHLLKSNYTVSISGWVPVERADRLVKQVEAATGEEHHLEFQEVKEEEYEKVPILLNNGPLTQPFEGLVEMYSLPQYDELDPTPLMAPFYAIAFGMMVADFGYGLLLFLAILIGKRLFYFKPGMKRQLTFFQLCAIPTMAWGLIYGNIFGFEFSFQLLSTNSDITQILAISVIFGYLQVMFGLILKFYILWKKQDDKLRAFFQAGSWIFFLLSALVIVAGMLLMPESNLQQLGLIGLLVSLGMIVFGGSLDGQTLAGKFGSGLYGLMDVTSYLGDLISYTRLMALGVAGGSIAAAFNLIISYLPVAARFTVGILLFVALHGLNIFLSYLSAYVHGIRLQYLEFFGKFYTGGGRPFKPLKSTEQYVEVISEEKQQQEEE